MLKTFSKTIAAFCALALLFVFGAGCDSGSAAKPAVSTLTRPAAIAVATIPWTPSDTDAYDAQFYVGQWEECLGKSRRAFVFVANSGNDSVARIDACSGWVENTFVKGNPFVISHIAVGRLPLDLATSIDDDQSRVFVANSGEQTLSIIDSARARTLQNKVELSSRPSRLIVVPSASGVPEGDIYVAMPDIGKLARVVKVSSDPELWVEDLFVPLETALTPDPIPAGMAVRDSADARYLYVTDMNHEYFHIVDLQNPGFPARVRRVYAAQRSCSISRDGRYLYLPKLDQRRVAVWDLEADEYVDTNSELSSHRNSPAPSEQFNYDIELQSVMRKVVFVDVVKSFDEPEVDGDSDYDGEMDSDTDGELSDGDADAAEGETDAAADGDADSARRFNASESSPKALRVPKRQYAYAIGFNGNIQVIDMQENLHELFDTVPDTAPELNRITGDELQVDSDMCLADINYRLTYGSTPDAYWEMRYNALIPESDATVSGRFDASANRFSDTYMDFSALEELLPRPDAASDDDPYALKGDWLEILDRAMPGCVQTLDENGEEIYKEISRVRLEIVDATPDYLVYRNPLGIDIDSCFNTAVSYQITSNGNYLVYMTEMDTEGNRLGNPIYQGRAINTPFFPDYDVVSSREEYEELTFQEEDYFSYVCEMEDGTYRFQEDLKLADSGETQKGTRCMTRLTDGEDYPVSFENDMLTFSVCQDVDGEFDDMRLKREDTYTYAFRTVSGINEINVTLDDGSSADILTGSILEDAEYLNAYPDFPRLYVVDSTEELVYIIDLKTDQIIGAIQ